MSNTTDSQLEVEMAGPIPTEIRGYTLGLRLEAGGKKVSHTTFEDKIGCLTKDQIGKILTDPKRISARIEFDVSWILSQGRRSSCASYATGAIMEKSLARQCGQRVKLGPEFIYANVNGGRDRGSILRRNIEFAMEGGCALRDLVPYESYLKRDMGPEAQMSAKRFRIAEGEIVGVHSEEELASALALNWLVLVAVQVEDPWFKLDADGVVMPVDGDGNHAIHCDDIRINSKGGYEFDHAGSWGKTYGDMGRGFITWQRHLRGTVRNHEFVAIRAMLPDPDGIKLPERRAA